MSVSKGSLILIIGLFSLFPFQAFSQQVNYRDSLPLYRPEKVNLKPSLNYMVGSTFVVVPRLGTFTGFTISPFLSVPLSPRLSVDGGIIAGRYYSSLLNFNPESPKYGVFNELSVYGSATYQINSHLDIYGAGIRQLAGTNPYFLLPGSSYTIGSNLHFGSFSIGASLRVSNWNDSFNLLPFSGSQGFYNPYLQGPGTLPPFNW